MRFLRRVLALCALLALPACEGLKRVGPFALLLVLSLPGCWAEKRPPEVEAGVLMRQSAMVAYDANVELCFAVLLDAYREAEYARIESDFEGDVDDAVAGGPLTKGDLKELNRLRAEARAKVDSMCKRVAAVLKRARTDGATALRLTAVLEQYNTGGLDLGSATEVINQVLELASKGIGNVRL